ncbi:MAG: Gfo/Idh/MocA family protein [Candidatus Bathycorpusculaceae bacterium]
MKALVGVVGAGYIAQSRHLPVYKDEQLAKIQAICEADHRRAWRVAKVHNIPCVYRNLEEMLSKEALDIVDICSSASAHAPLAIQALKQGINVIVEKPMAMDFESAKQVYEVARSSKKKFTVVQNYRFMQQYKALKKAVKKGQLGRVDALYGLFDSPSTGFTDQFRPEYKYGILFETGIHDIDIARDLLGEVVSTETIMTRKSLDGHAHAVISILEHKNNAVSILRLSFKAATSAHRLEVNGSKIRAFLDYETDSLEFERMFRLSSIKEQIRFAKNELSKTFKMFKHHYSSMIWRGMNEFGGLAPFKEIIHRFVRCVLENAEPPVTLDEAYMNMKILEACRLSLETGQKQRIADLK